MLVVERESRKKYKTLKNKNKKVVFIFLKNIMHIKLNYKLLIIIIK